MSNVNGGGLDLKTLDPATLEFVARVAYQNKATIAPYLLLGWLDALAVGLSVVMFIEWWNTSRGTERRWSRYLVYWTMLSIIAWTIMYQYFTLLWFGQEFGRYSHWVSVDWVKPSTVLGAAVRIPTMCFYMHRAYVLVQRRVWVIILATPLILCTFVPPIAQFLILHTIPTPPALRHIWVLSACAEVACDIILTTTIAVQLYRSKTGWSSTDRLISKLLFTLAETMTPPTCVSIILLIVLYTSPDTSAQALILFYPKVAFLCIAATLLSRVRIVQAHIENGGGGKYASSGGSTTGMTMSEGAVFYGQDKGGLVHVSRGGEGDEKKAAERGRGKEVKTAGTVMSAALTESTIEPEDAWRGSQV